MAELKLNYCVYHPGDHSAGMWGYSETVTLTVESGDPGGDPGEFAETLRQRLAEWFDGAKVILGEWKDVFGDEPELCQSGACARSLHNECPDVEANCCDCPCHVR